MAEYYYFASTLPMLSMGKELPITYEEFMAKAREQLSKKDYRDLEKAVFSSSADAAGNPVVREWQEYSEKIRAVMNSVRAEKLGFPGYEVVSGGEKIFEDRIRSIVEDLDPLEGERALLGMYFDFLSSREGGSPFSSRALMIYSLKLQLMERSSSFSQEKGLEEFDRLYKEIETDIFR